MQTLKGTPYLTEPRVITLAYTQLPNQVLGLPMGSVPGDRIDGLNSTVQSLGFPNWGDDQFEDAEDSEWLIKFSGQLCYLSFGSTATPNAETKQYIDTLKAHKNGSVLEHASASFWFTGISRSCTHELVRHRAGFAYSQVSQRYVDNVRFVERPEYQNDTWLHGEFIKRIDTVVEQYKAHITYLMDDPKYLSMGRTERRKAVRQVARSLLPNETEAPIVVTANFRAWRHWLEMRASAKAETEICKLAVKVHEQLMTIAPYVFHDYAPDGGGLTTPYVKV